MVVLLSRKNGGRAVDSISELLEELREERVAVRRATDRVERRTRGAQKIVDSCRIKIESKSEQKED